MADPSGSPHFQARFESALQAYQTKTGITLAEHTLAVQLQSCNTVESITTLVQSQAQAFSDYQESDRIMKSIKAIVSVLTSLSATAPLADASVLHGWPWGFFEPPVPLAAENRTQSHRCRKLKGTGMGPMRLPVFPRALRVMGF
jgi:hypothetical protein